jgi:hypothetical protein
LAREKFDVDVVLCLGYLYHTYRHTELMYRIHQLAPTHLILDTLVAPGSQRSVQVFLERNPENILSAGRDPYSLDRVLVAHPTVPALQMMLAAYGFEIESMYDWKRRLASLNTPAPGLRDYGHGRRATLRCRSRQSPTEDGWEPVALVPVPPARPGKHGRKQTPTPRPPQPTARWRTLANRGLVKATGYELRRASPHVKG